MTALDTPEQAARPTGVTGTAAIESPSPGHLAAATDGDRGGLRHAPQGVVTLLVPTRNEAANVAALVERLDALDRGIIGEIIFVDDSDDDTPSVVERVAQHATTPVRLVHRDGDARHGGLSSAVVAGLRLATTDYVCVMDGDLQHPPEKIAELLAAARDGGADIVVGTRYGHGGPHTTLSLPRKAVSHASGACTRTLFGCMRGVTDPMSGFFLVRRSAIDIERLRPIGFKILLEVLVRNPGLRRAEVPFTFGERHAGASKASGAEGFRFLAHLVRLRLPAPESRWARAAAFVLVGGLGLLVNQLALWLGVEALSINYLVAAVLATQVSSSVNFAFTELWVFGTRRGGSRLARYGAFMAVSNVLLLARIPLLALLVSGLGINYLVANLITLVLLVVARFAVADGLIWRTPKMAVTNPTMAFVGGAPASEPTHLIDLRPGARPGAVGVKTARHPHRYDLHGIVTIESAIRLPELGWFAVDHLAEPDVRISVGTVGRRGPRRRSHCEQAAGSVLYQEHMGGLFANFAIDIQDRIEVVVSPWLARSPHVVYTNIVEALLRFVLVSKGYMLLHSACITVDGRNVMLSAKTDTGKTGTILRLLRERGGEFLSDDMTILDGNGQALCYPKPLTISAHTLRAVEADVLRTKERAMLAVQSRLHSKGGRSVGSRLAAMNLPIMFLNATTQAVVPPPKYMVDRLVSCTYGRSARIDDLFIIERGAPDIADVEPQGLVDELLENTDDAYGFPPFSLFAPTIVIGGEGYLTLRARERAILASAMRSIRARRVASDSFSWADVIPELLSEPEPSPRPATLVVPIDQPLAGS